MEPRREIWSAKKLIYDDYDTKRAFNISVTTLGVLLVHFLVSMGGLDDNWTCEIESTNNRGHYICTELRRNMNCKTISGPIKSEIFLKVLNKELQASALIQCPWEMAVSEIRLCFIFLSIISVLVGFYALKKTSKRYGELAFQTGIAFSALQLIASYFDYVSIKTSQINNYNLCKMQEEFQVEDKMTGQMECSYSFYYSTVLLGLLAAVLLLTNAFQLNTWRLKIITDADTQEPV